MHIYIFKLIVLVSAFDDVWSSFLFARVSFVPSMLLLRLFSLSLSRVCLLFACLFVRVFACQAVSMYASLCARCLFLYVGFRFVFALCCRVRLLFVFVVALFGSALHLMGPGLFSQE